MIADKFALARFEALGHDTPESRRLAEELAAAIRLDLHTVVTKELHRVIETLKEGGLEFREDKPEKMGDVSFGCDWTDGRGEHNRLEFEVATIVAAGYSHLVSPEEAWAEVEDQLKAGDTNDCTDVLKGHGDSE